MATEQYLLSTRRSLIQWYKEQLARFYKIGVGNVTEWNTTVSDKLIDTTKLRIVQLGGERALDTDWGTSKKYLSKKSETKISTLRVREFRARLAKQINKENQS